MGHGARRSLVLKTNSGAVIHKSLVYQRLEILRSTFHQSGGASLSPENSFGIKGHDRLIGAAQSDLARLSFASDRVKSEPNVT